MLRPTAVAMKSFKNKPDVSPKRTRPPFPQRWPGWRVFWTTFHLRDLWWFILDYLESHASLRRWLYGLVACTLLFAGLVIWGYPRWNEYRTLQQARQWLASGHYRYAVEAAQEAMIAAPASPEPWKIAAELAQIGGQYQLALDYARRAAELAPQNPDVLITWAAAALRADTLADVDRALDQIPVEIQAQSAHVQRLRGELARRQQRFTPAQAYFEAAAKLEGPRAVNEVPLALVLLNSTQTPVRQQGLGLLLKWTDDREWGATALRMLLADAQKRMDKPTMFKWAEALRAHPGCTVSDMPNCLLALSLTNEIRFTEILRQLELDHAASPKAAAQLLSWLNQIGRGREAVIWMKTLPADALRRPPLVVAAAEAMRIATDWPDLLAWCKRNEWGADVEFLRWSYGLHAAQKLGDQKSADEFLSTLKSHAQRNSVHGLFAASSLYSWGNSLEAEGLWWQAADHDDQVAIDALGSLARFYQVNRDADGQYRVFRQLNQLRGHDAAIRNNFAFFAALTGREQRSADQLSRENLNAEPTNPVYAATRAFVLFTQNKSAEALQLIAPFLSEEQPSPALDLVHGLTLAATRHTIAANLILNKLPPDTLTQHEIDLIKKALAN